MHVVCCWLQLNDASRAAVVSDIRKHYSEGEVHLNEVQWRRHILLPVLQRVLGTMSLNAH